MFNFKFTVAVAALALTGVAQAGTNLVSDGTFSEAVGSYTTIGKSGSIGAWTVGGNSVDLIGNYWTAPVGHSIDLDGNAPGAISQDLHTLGEGEYTVSFELAGNPDGGTTTKSVAVAIDGVTHDFTFDTTGHSTGNMGFVTE